MDRNSSLELATSYKPPHTDLHELLQFDYSVIRTQACSARGESTRYFDDFEDLKQKVNAKTMLQYRILNIHFWTVRFASEVVKDIQVTYQNIDNWTIITTSKKYGWHSLFLNQAVFQFNHNELILDAQLRTGDSVDQLKFMTSKSRTITVGGEGGDLDSFEIGEGNVIIGTHGSICDNLQSIGFYVAPLREVKYWQKRAYILMKAELTRSKEIQEDMQKVIENNHNNKTFLAEIAFAMLVLKGDQVFARVMRFI